MNILQVRNRNGTMPRRASDMNLKPSNDRADESVRSGMTADEDMSGHYGLYSRSLSAPMAVSGDKVRVVKGCMKVRTQRESLNQSNESEKIARGSLSSDISFRSILEENESGKLRYGTVEIREYPIILGDNPSTCAGPPLSIGWKPFPDSVTINLDQYEESREGSIRSKSELALPPDVRRDMLRFAGYSRQEVQDTIDKAKKERERRLASVQQMKFDPLFEKVDKVRRGIKRMGSKGKGKDAVLWSQ